MMDDLGPEDFDTRPLTRKARRRGMLLAVAVLLVGGVVGGALGWSSDTPLYRAQGLIYLQQSVFSPSDPTGAKAMPMFDGYVAFQADLLASERCATMAMSTNAWRGAGESQDAEGVAAFQARARVERPDGKPHIVVSFRDPDPDVALAGVRALIEAYTKLSADLNDANESLEYARAQLDVLNAKLKVTTERILALTAEYGGVEGLEIRHRAAIRQLIEAEEQLMQLRRLIRDAKSEAGPDGVAPKAASEIALENPQVAKILLELDLLEAEEQYLAQKQREDGPALAALRRRIAAHRQRIEQLAEAWNRVRAVKQAGGATLSQLQDREQRLVAQLEMLRARGRKISATRADVERFQVEQADLQRQLKQMETLKDELTSQLLGKGRIRIADPGSRPTGYFRDRRESRLGLWAVFGALPGLLALLFFAFRGKRPQLV